MFSDALLIIFDFLALLFLLVQNWLGFYYRVLLFLFLDEENFYKCPDRLRLPLIFYYCHPAVVFVNKLKLAGLIQVNVGCW